MIPIVFSTDHNYVMPTGITILSLLLTNKDQAFDIFILCGEDVTIQDKELIRRQVNIVSSISQISFINIFNEFKNSFEIRDISIACYYRLLIPWLLPKYDKIIYSDVDIIFKSDITPFYDLDVADYFVAGVNTPGFMKSKSFQKYILKHGVQPDKYINSGFILINAKKMRGHELKDKFLELSKRKFRYQDQDILNIVANNATLLVDQRYNISPRRISPNGKLRLNDVVVLHYAGDKPWKTLTYQWREWWNIYDKSVFYTENFCEDVTKSVLDPKHFLLNLWKKFKNKYLHR